MFPKNDLLFAANDWSFKKNNRLFETKRPCILEEMQGRLK